MISTRNVEFLSRVTFPCDVRHVLDEIEHNFFAILRQSIILYIRDSLELSYLSRRFSRHKIFIILSMNYAFEITKRFLNILINRLNTILKIG